MIHRNLEIHLLLVTMSLLLCLHICKANQRTYRGASLVHSSASHPKSWKATTTKMIQIKMIVTTETRTQNNEVLMTRIGNKSIKHFSQDERCMIEITLTTQSQNLK